MLHRLCEPLPIPLSFTLASVLRDRRYELCLARLNCARYCLSANVATGSCKFCEILFADRRSVRGLDAAGLFIKVDDNGSEGL